jgi:hypothetical protein
MTVRVQTESGTPALSVAAVVADRIVQDGNFAAVVGKGIDAAAAVSAAGADIVVHRIVFDDHRLIGKDLDSRAVAAFGFPFRAVGVHLVVGKPAGRIFYLYSRSEVVTKDALRNQQVR